MRGNLANEAGRYNEVGQCWEEVNTNSNTAVEVPKYHSLRVRMGAAAGTVTIDGILAASMAANEILIFNAGNGTPDDGKETVTFTFSQAVYAQIGRQGDRR